MKIQFKVNNKLINAHVAPDEFLLETLRKLGFPSVKQGCDSGNCGLCTVWVDGKAALACATLSIRSNDKEITTIEGLEEEAATFGQFMLAEGADQCGFCSPGFIMTILAMKRELKNPTEEMVVHYLTGNLCRCTGYMSQLRAIKKYLGVQ